MRPHTNRVSSARSPHTPGVANASFGITLFHSHSPGTYSLLQYVVLRRELE